MQGSQNSFARAKKTSWWYATGPDVIDSLASLFMFRILNVDVMGMHPLTLVLAGQLGHACFVLFPPRTHIAKGSCHERWQGHLRFCLRSKSYYMVYAGSRRYKT